MTDPAHAMYSATRELPAHLRDWQLPPGWKWGSEGLVTQHRHYQEIIDALDRSLSLVSAPNPEHHGWLESEARHHSTYLRLARLFAPEEDVRLRLHELAAAEARIMAEGVEIIFKYWTEPGPWRFERLQDVVVAAGFRVGHDVGHKQYQPEGRPSG